MSYSLVGVPLTRSGAWIFQAPLFHQIGLSVAQFVVPVECFGERIDLIECSRSALFLQQVQNIVSFPGTTVGSRCLLESSH